MPPGHCGQRAFPIDQAAVAAMGKDLAAGTLRLGGYLLHMGIADAENERGPVNIICEESFRAGIRKISNIYIGVFLAEAEDNVGEKKAGQGNMAADADVLHLPPL